MPGHHDAGNEYTSLEDAQNAALYAKEQGLGGKYCLNYNSTLISLINMEVGINVEVEILW
jgi:hypothetical protein